MSITVRTEPNSIQPIYTDYKWQYSSDLYNLINFKYKINFDTYVSGTTFTTTDTFERYPEPNTYATFNLRKYLSSKFESDYFYDNRNNNNSIQPNPLETKFRLRIQEEFAYQFTYGNNTDSGVSANSTKFYNLYDLKLTNLDNIAPVFTVGAVIEIIDNSNPITNDLALNGIYTVLAVGSDYIVINAVYDPSRTYYSGSVLWSDRRQVVNSATTYTSSTFTALNSCNTNSNKHIYTSLQSNSNLRVNSLLMLPIIVGKTVKVMTDESVPVELFNDVLTTGTTGNGLLVYKTPTTPKKIKVIVYNNSSSVLEELPLNIEDKCTGRFNTVTLYFLDRSGAFIPFYFDLVNIKSIQTTNSNWKSLNEFGRTQKNQIDTQVTEQYQLTTDWLTDKESDLFEELFTSNYIWMDYGVGETIVYQKVLIVDKQTQVKKTHNNKLFNYQINVEISSEKFLLQ